jgi:hypothetical protein
MKESFDEFNITTTPERARSDYLNEIRGLTFLIMERTTDSEFIEALKKVGFSSMQSFSEKYGDEKLFPGVVESQSKGLIERLDFVVNEINLSFQDETLTVAQVRKNQAIIESLLK